MEINPDQIDIFIAKQEQFKLAGLVYEISDHKIIILETPALIAQTDIKNLLDDIIADFDKFDDELSFTEAVQSTLGTHACHHSIRAGRPLSINEMNAILREMENTSFSGQCNHGRPTYIELKLSDIETLFGRR